MTPDTKKAPVLATGASPFSLLDLLSVGVRSPIRMGTLTEGDVVLHPDAPYVVVRTVGNRQRTSRYLLVRDVGSSTLRNVLNVPNSWVLKLELPEATMSHLNLGDVVLYPGGPVEPLGAAIRSHNGWSRTLAPWTPACDVEILLHLQQQRAQIVRNFMTPGSERPYRMPVGTVVATRDLTVREPTVWVRTAPNYWIGSVRGLTASDLMINHELNRRIYETVWVPTPRGT